jgi:hypothetical protein
MFPLQFLFDPVPTTTSVVFHRLNSPSYWSIPKKLLVWFLYLVPVLSLVTSVPFVFPHTHCKLQVHFHWPVHQVPYFLCLDFYWFAKQLPLTSRSTHLPSYYLKSIYSTKRLSPFSPMPRLSSWVRFSCLVLFWFIFLFVLGFLEDVSRRWFG